MPALHPLIKSLARAYGRTAAASLVLAGPVFAQTTGGSAPDDKLQRVEVTGSSIKRIDAETSLPVQILKREDIARTGVSSTEDLIKTISALSSSGALNSNAGGSGYTGGNIATISLRGLTGARTLVLVNGRRMSVYGGGSSGAAGSSVDINNIPLSAIERVEILKDGASAIYGSDAIAGVVNFILVKDFTGVEATAGYGQPWRGGNGKEMKASVFGGLGKMADQGFNIMAGVDAQKTDPIFGADRDYARRINVNEKNEVLSTITFPANVFVYGTGALKTISLSDCGPVSQVSPFRPTTCRFDNSPFVSIQPKSEKANLLLNGKLRLATDIEGYLETGFGQTKTTTTTQPVPLSSYGNSLAANNPYNPVFKNLLATNYPTLNTTPLSRTFGTNTPGIFLLPTTSPYYPTAWANANGFTGLPLGLSYRDLADGPRQTLDTADNTRVALGAKGLFANWDFDTAILYTESKVKETLLSGYAQYSKSLPIFNSGIINPFGPTTDPAALDAVRAAEFYGESFNSKTSQIGVDIRASRDLFALPAGMAQAALGAEFRREKFAYTPSLALQQGDVVGIGGSTFPITAQRKVASAFAELSIPILPKLDADVAVRFDKYQTVGSTTNPKASVRWQPADNVLLRASAGTGFRAPSLTDLYTPQGSSVTANGTRDPIRCPDLATGSPTDCNFQFTTVTGGNPQLKPEKSESYTFGLVFEPFKDFSIGLDAFRIVLKDAIVPGGLSYTYFLANAARANQYSGFIVRGPADGNASGVGPITAILQTNANLFKTKVEGMDVDLKWTQRLAGGDKLITSLNGTYLGKYDVQGPDGSYSSYLDQALTASGGGVVLRWKHVANITYETGPWSGTLTQNFQKAYVDVLGNFAPAGSTPRMVAEYQTFDAQGSYSGFKNLKLTLGLKNLIDTNPPYTNNTSNFLGGYDSSYADVRGRFVYGSVSYRFN